MCDLSDGFRLCTCAGDGPVDWTLHRAAPRDAPLDGMWMERGLTLTPTETVELQALFVLDHLQAGTAFDTPYTPQEGDRLELHTLGPRGTSFLFEDGRWTVADDDPYAPPNAVRYGRVELHAEMGLDDVPLYRQLWERPYDPTLRAVAVDALLEAGHDVMARWLQVEPDTEAPAAVFRDLAAKISLRVRARFAHAPLSCRRKRCPGRWERLPVGDDPEERRCRRCRRPVRFRDGPARDGRQSASVASSRFRARGGS
jgi:hypothetical protein